LPSFGFGVDKDHDSGRTKGLECRQTGGNTRTSFCGRVGDDEEEGLFFFSGFGLGFFELVDAKDGARNIEFGEGVSDKKGREDRADFDFRI